MSRFLLIQARNFGDAVISTGMIEALGNSFVDAEIAVLTRPQFRTIFANNPLVTSVYCASFPMGTVKNFRTREAVHLAARVAKLRHRRFTVVSLAGDFRENALGWLINPQGNYGVIWADEHPYRKLVRQGMTSLLTGASEVPASSPNIYDAMERLAATVHASTPARPRLYDHQRRPIDHQISSEPVIGFHMFAGQPQKLWPLQNWRRLVTMAQQAGFTVIAFGALRERERIQSALPNLADAQIVTGPLQEFFEGFSRMRVVVCLDSFSIHVAHAVGTPSVMIDTASLADIILPPGAISTTHGVSAEQVWSAVQQMNQMVAATATIRTIPGGAAFVAVNG